MVCAPVQRDNPRALAKGIIDRTGAQTMLYLTCTTISSADLAQYGVSLANDWVSVECGTTIGKVTSGHLQLSVFSTSIDVDNELILIQIFTQAKLLW